MGAWMVALALILQSLIAVPHAGPRSSLVGQLSELSAAIGPAVVICEHDGDAAQGDQGGPAREHNACNDCCILCSALGGGVAPPPSVADFVQTNRAPLVVKLAQPRDADASAAWAGLPNPARGPPSFS